MTPARMTDLGSVSYSVTVEQIDYYASEAAGRLAREAARWRLAELTATVRARASQPFPVEPVRGLDAIHLASALEVVELYPDLQVLAFDERVRANLAPLGLAATDAL